MNFGRCVAFFLFLLLLFFHYSQRPATAAALKGKEFLCHYYVFFFRLSFSLRVVVRLLHFCIFLFISCWLVLFIFFVAASSRLWSRNASENAHAMAQGGSSTRHGNIAVRDERVSHSNRRVARFACALWMVMVMMMMSFAGGAYLRDVRATCLWLVHWLETTALCHSEIQFSTIIFAWIHAFARMSTRDVLLHFTKFFRLLWSNSGLLDGFGSGINSKSTQSHKIPLMLVVPRTMPYSISTLPLLPS